MSGPTFKAGQKVRVRTAFDGWTDAVTLSGVEGTHADGRKIHDFPVVWVDTSGHSHIPWPIEDVRHVNPACDCGCRTVEGGDDVKGDGDDRAVSVGSKAKGYWCPKDGFKLTLLDGGAWCEVCHTVWREIDEVSLVDLDAL